MFEHLISGLVLGVSIGWQLRSLSVVFIFLFIDCGITSALDEGCKLARVELQLWIFCEYDPFEVISISVILFY